MKKTIFAGVAVILLCALFFAVQHLPSDTENENTDLTAVENEEKATGDAIVKKQEEKVSVNKFIVEECDYYTVFEYENFTYDYYIKDKNGNEIFSVKGSPDYPMMSQETDDILSACVQLGTGKSTRIKHYFNIETSEVSKPFSYVLGEVGEDVIYVDFDKDRGYSVVACKMFDNTDIDCIAILEDVYTVEPITECSVSEDLIRIVYLKGKDYVETEISIVPEKI